ncbi:MAG: low molecular weight phosphotyrosine protein phosphatase [Proteobacteria bacterium]|nr:low molecular weight phosphotyrosine protein phosphatase [Pseudomonadota bacterium]
MKKILFVCTGNICRSPTAEAVLRQMATNANKTVQVDSAGTGDWHSGAAPDPRACDAASYRGYRMDGMIARQVQREDFTNFDVLYAMTAEHLAYLHELAPSALQHKALLFLADTMGKEEDVPDPYYGGDVGFEQMMDLLEAGCENIIKKIP